MNASLTSLHVCGWAIFSISVRINENFHDTLFVYKWAVTDFPHFLSGDVLWLAVVMDTGHLDLIYSPNRQLGPAFGRFDCFCSLDRHAVLSAYSQDFFGGLRLQLSSSLDSYLIEAIKNLHVFRIFAVWPLSGKAVYTLPISILQPIPRPLCKWFPNKWLWEGLRYLK